MAKRRRWQSGAPGEGTEAPSHTPWASRPSGWSSAAFILTLLLKPGKRVPRVLRVTAANPSNPSRGWWEPQIYSQSVRGTGDNLGSRLASGVKGGGRGRRRTERSPRRQHCFQVDGVTTAQRGPAPTRPRGGEGGLGTGALHPASGEQPSSSLRHRRYALQP